MTLRSAAAVGLVLIVMPAMSAAQVAGTVQGAPTPGPTAPRPQTPPRDGGAVLPTGTGRIRGRVVAADTGTPLRRAQVRVSGTLPGLQQVTDTDADGRYEFFNVPASRYTISVTRPGYVSMQFGQENSSQPAKPINLVDGETVEKIDVALPRGAVIAGRILDDLGEPVAGVRVQAQRYVYQSGGERRLIGAGPMPGPPLTDDLGQFRIYGLIPGSYVLSADPQMSGGITIIGGPATPISAGVGADASDGYATTYYPGTSNIAEAQTVAVNVGQEANVSFALVSARMSRISGVIRNSLGNPVAMAPITLRRREGAGSIGGMTQVDGSFTLTRVPPGEHSIEVRPIPAGRTGPFASAASDEFASVPVVTAGQDITGLIITTGLGASISGRLVFEGNSPPPQKPAQPIRVFITSVDPYNASTGNTTQDSGLVDDTGHFQIRGVSGQLLFRTSVQGWSLKSVTLNGVDITDTPFDAKPSTNTTGLEVTVTDRPTVVTGNVKNALGEAAKKSVIAVFPADGKEGTQALRFTRTIVPDQDGRYSTRGLPPGEYVAVAVQSFETGSEWDPAFQQQTRPRGKTFRLTEGESLTLDLTVIQ